MTGTLVATAIASAGYAETVGNVTFSTANGGSKHSGLFTRNGNYMYVCGDIINGTTPHTLKSKLIREIDWLPDTVRREVWSYYLDPKRCSSPGFLGSSGEWYDNQAEWVDEGSAAHSGSTRTER
jgi:hypothetical protein